MPTRSKCFRFCVRAYAAFPKRVRELYYCGHVVALPCSCRRAISCKSEEGICFRYAARCCRNMRRLKEETKKRVFETQDSKPTFSALCDLSAGLGAKIRCQ